MEKVKKENQKNTEKVGNVRFVKNPTGMFHLGYSENMVINRSVFPEDKIKELIDKGYLEVCD